MAKKRSRRGSFNMSAAVRDVVKQHPEMSAKQVEAEIRKQHPGQKINTSSLSVAFSNARRKLGITKKRSVRRRKPSATKRASVTLDMATLQAARKYVSEVGDVDAALDAVRQLKTLQIGS